MNFLDDEICHSIGERKLTLTYKSEFLDDVWDLLCDSFHLGDLDEWTTWIEIHRRDGFVLFRTEDHEGEFRVAREDLPRGLDLILGEASRLEGESGYDPIWWPSYTLTGLRIQDACEFDAISIDTMVQLMVFGEVVYG